MSITPVTEADILDAIRAAIEKHRNGGEPGVTTNEYAEARGIGVLKARAEIRTLLVTGEAVVVQVRRRRMDGLDTLVPGYRLKEVP